MRFAPRAPRRESVLGGDGREATGWGGGAHSAAAGRARARSRGAAGMAQPGADPCENDAALALALATQVSPRRSGRARKPPLRVGPEPEPRRAAPAVARAVIAPGVEGAAGAPAAPAGGEVACDSSAAAAEGAPARAGAPAGAPASALVGEPNADHASVACDAAAVGAVTGGNTAAAEQLPVGAGAAQDAAAALNVAQFEVEERKPDITGAGANAELVALTTEADANAARAAARGRAESLKVFWYKPKGYPFWPVQVVDVEKCEEFNNVDLEPVIARKVKKPKADTLVQYFGEEQFDWIAASALVPFSVGLDKGFDKKKRGVPTALQVAWALLERDELSKFWWCRPRPDTPPPSPVKPKPIKVKKEKAAKTKKAQKQKGKAKGPPPKPAPPPQPKLGLLPPVSSTWLTAKPRRRRENIEDADGKRSWRYAPGVGEPFDIFSDFMCPTEVMDITGPKYGKLSRSTWVSAPRCRPVPKADVQVCNCKPAPNGGPSCLEQCLNRQTKTFCHPTLCPCGEACTNKPFHKLKSPPVKVFATEGRGWGVKAAAAIPAGTFVVEYIGELIGEADVEARLWEAKHTGEDNFYMMQIDDARTIDARHRGNFSRLLNSGCEPNCETERWTDPATGEARIGIFTKRDVKEGEELIYDYCFQHFGTDASATSFVCICGAPSCRGALDAARALTDPREMGKGKGKGKGCKDKGGRGGKGGKGKGNGKKRRTSCQGSQVAAKAKRPKVASASGLFAGRPVAVTYDGGALYNGVVAICDVDTGTMVVKFSEGEEESIHLAEGGVEFTDREHTPDEAAALARVAAGGHGAAGKVGEDGSRGGEDAAAVTNTVLSNGNACVLANEVEQQRQAEQHKQLGEELSQQQGGQ